MEAWLNKLPLPEVIKDVEAQTKMLSGIEVFLGESRADRACAAE